MANTTCPGRMKNVTRPAERPPIKAGIWCGRESDKVHHAAANIPSFSYNTVKKAEDPSQLLMGQSEVIR